MTKKPGLSLPSGTNKLRVLGLDTSSKCIGWGLFEGKKLLKYGKYRFDPSHEHGQKLLQFHNFLTDLFKASKPDEVIIEMPYRSSAYGILMWYVAVVLLAHFEVLGKELPKHNQMHPRSIKDLMEVVNKKKSTHDEHKATMVARINELFGLVLEFRPRDVTKRESGDDIADAIATAWAWIRREYMLTHGRPADYKPSRNRKRTKKTTSR